MAAGILDPEFGGLIEQHGSVLLPAVLDWEIRDRLCAELEAAYSAQREIQVRNQVDDGAAGAVHHLPLMGGALLEFLERGYAATQLAAFFGAPYIVSTYGGVLNLPDNLSYVGRAHRDLRTFSGDVRLMAQLW